MNTKTSAPKCGKRALFWILFASASILLLIPAVLNGMRPAPNSQTSSMQNEPVPPMVWQELHLVRQLVQAELGADLRAAPDSARQDALQHFRQAMASLPAPMRAQPALRDIAAEAEDDFELLQLENRTIRKLAAQQLVQEIPRIEQFIRAQQ